MDTPTLSTKSQALNVWGGLNPDGAITDQLRISMSLYNNNDPNDPNGPDFSLATFITHKDANNELMPVVFTGPLVFSDHTGEHKVASRFASVESSVQAERTRAEAEEKKNFDLIISTNDGVGAGFAQHASNLAAEVTRATEREGTLSSKIAAEVAARIAAVNTLTNSIDGAVTDMGAADAIHSADIAALQTRVIDAEETTTNLRTSLENNIHDVAGIIGNQIGGLNTTVTADRISSVAADAALTTSVTAARTFAQGLVDAEKARSEGVEASLQTQITSLLSNTDEVALN